VWALLASRGHRFSTPGRVKSLEARPHPTRKSKPEGGRAHSVSFFKTWRHLSNWLTKVVIAECADLSTVEERVAQNADWRHAEPAGEYLRETLLKDVDRVHWAQEHGISPHELREMLAGVETWVAVDSRRLERSMMSAAQG